MPTQPTVRVDVLVVAVALYVWWRLRRRCEPAIDPERMPRRPPVRTTLPELPRWLGWQLMSLLGLRSYVWHGLADLEDYLLRSAGERLTGLLSAGSRPEWTARTAATVSAWSAGLSGRCATTRANRNAMPVG